MVNNEETVPVFLTKQVLSIKVTPDDREFFTENYDTIADGKDITNARAFLLAAVEKAISRVKSVIKEVPDPLHVAEINNLKNDKKELYNTVLSQENQIKQFTALEKVMRPYLLICERDNLADNLADVFYILVKDIATLSKGKAWQFDEADKAYLKENGL
ncbi:MAG: hypothetical protein NTX61_08195 [Bacteroidetes bacterium]|nr:hypothetical protein [Bacteroidota bacterium]